MSSRRSGAEAEEEVVRSPWHYIQRARSRAGDAIVAPNKYTPSARAAAGAAASADPGGQGGDRPTAQQRCGELARKETFLEVRLSPESLQRASALKAGGG